MTFMQIKNLFLDNFKEIKGKYLQEKDEPWVESLEDMGMHIFLGDYVEPYLSRLLKEKEKESLKNLLVIIERTLLEIEDSSLYDNMIFGKDYYEESIKQSILEGFHVGENYEMLSELCGENTLKILKELKECQEL